MRSRSLIVLAATLLIAAFVPRYRLGEDRTAASDAEQHTLWLPIAVKGCPQAEVVQGRGITTNYSAGVRSVYPDGTAMLGTSWQYNHGVGRRWDRQFSCLGEAVPMLWCATPELWHNFVQRVPEDYTGPILLYNEIDRPDQCTATMSDLVLYYQKMINRHSPQQIVWGNVSQIDYYTGWLVLTQFYSAIIEAGLPFDPLGVHMHEYCYSGHPRDQFDSLIDLLDGWGVNHPELEIWVSEYGCAQAGGVAQMSRYYEQQPKITRWAYFAPCQPPEMGTGLFDVVEWVPGQNGSLRCGKINDRGLAFAGTDTDR